ncbi:MAG TPA: NAD(P)/FAD-dependent oxidoreductase [Nitrosospira sp.]|nr:NAD(P)/FAD-dependent oxidoreductase [Nitrosospira sp.]
MFPDRRISNVVVIGGGPAGAICALALARAGVDVKLAYWGGYAPGGIELVSGRARHFIEQYCPNFFSEVVHGIEIHETVSLWDTAEPVIFNAMFNPWGAGVAVDRPLLDDALRNLASDAGSTVIPDAKVVDVERQHDQWRLIIRSPSGTSSDETAPGPAERAIYARFIVLATGRVPLPFFDHVPVSEPSQIALMTSLQARAAPGHALYIEGTSSGWWYALPTEKSYFTGFCIERNELKRRQSRLKDFFFQELQRTRLLAPLSAGTLDTSPISGRTAGTITFPTMGGDGWIAVGDATLAPDPLSGMGIEWAIESAQLGADMLQEALRKSEGNILFDLPGYEYAIRQRAASQEKTAAYHYRRLGEISEIKEM